MNTPDRPEPAQDPVDALAAHLATRYGSGPFDPVRAARLATQWWADRLDLADHTGATMALANHLQVMFPDLMVTWTNACRVAEQAMVILAVHGVFRSAPPLTTQQLADRLAQHIRAADGDHSMPTCELAETIVGWLVAGGHLSAANQPAPQDTNTDDPTGGLTRWWRQTAETDLAMLLPKAREYSAHDLRMAGRILADMLGWDDADNATCAEIATAWYLVSKAMRAMGAYKEHRLPSADTLTDLRVYATMAARIREAGGWPTGDPTDNYRASCYLCQAGDPHEVHLSHEEYFGQAPR